MKGENGSKNERWGKIINPRESGSQELSNDTLKISEKYDGKCIYLCISQNLLYYQ